MKKFEYTIVSTKPGAWLSARSDGDRLVSKFNELGMEGWELTGQFDSGHFEGGALETVFIFKREYQLYLET